MKQILIVDDGEMNRDILSKVLKKEKMQTKEAIDGAQAIELIEKNEFDLMILDIMMPEVDGFGVIEHIRKKLNNPIPIIVLSSLGYEESINRALDLGADAYFVKPIKIKMMLKKIEELFNAQPTL